jgi:hypothetical protein
MPGAGGSARIYNGFVMTPNCREQMAVLKSFKLRFSQLFVRYRILWLAAALMAGVAHPMLAAGEITGTIRDSSDAVISDGMLIAFIGMAMSAALLLLVYIVGVATTRDHSKWR